MSARCTNEPYIQSQSNRDPCLCVSDKGLREEKERRFGYFGRKGDQLSDDQNEEKYDWSKRALDSQKKQIWCPKIRITKAGPKFDGEMERGVMVTYIFQIFRYAHEMIGDTGEIILFVQVL